MRANASSLLLQFLTTRDPRNEEMLYYVMDPALRADKPQNSVDRVPQELLDLNANEFNVKSIKLKDLIGEKLSRLNEK